MNAPTVTAEWLRQLANLVEDGTVSVIRCDLKPRGIVLGVVEPRKNEAVPTAPAQK
jgi:hypothetical protein